jgi:hypothetical protein
MGPHWVKPLSEKSGFLYIRANVIPMFFVETTGPDGQCGLTPIDRLLADGVTIAGIMKGRFEGEIYHK